MSQWWVLALNIGLWPVIHATTGYYVHRLPDRRLDHDSWLWRARAWERGGRFYTRWFRVGYWKSRLPEAGAFFAGGVDKRHLAGRSDTALTTYVRETRRAELGHWLAAAATPIFFTFNQWPADLVMITYAVVVNGPCIIALRYNRLRILAISDRRRQRREGRNEAVG